MLDIDCSVLHVHQFHEMLDIFFKSSSRVLESVWDCTKDRKGTIRYREPSQHFHQVYSDRFKNPLLFWQDHCCIPSQILVTRSSKAWLLIKSRNFCEKPRTTNRVPSVTYERRWLNRIQFTFTALEEECKPTPSIQFPRTATSARSSTSSARTPPKRGSCVRVLASKWFLSPRIKCRCTKMNPFPCEDSNLVINGGLHGHDTSAAALLYGTAGLSPHLSGNIPGRLLEGCVGDSATLRRRGATSEPAGVEFWLEFSETLGYRSPSQLP